MWALWALAVPPAIIGVAGALFFLGAGHLRPRFVQPLIRRGFATDLTHAAVNGVALEVPLAWLLRHLQEQAASFLSTTAGGNDFPFWQQGLVLFLGGDFLKWLTHRMQHAVPALWRLHRLHHSSEQLDSLSHARSHPLEFVINRVPFLLLFVVVLRIDLRLVAVFSLLDLLQGLWAHSNTHLNTRRLNRVFATQEFHHWHHALDHAAIDRNFGGFLSIWDWIFGTAYCREDRTVSGFGISGVRVGDRYVDHLVFPIRASSSREAPSSRDPSA